MSDMFIFDTASVTEFKRTARLFTERCEAILEGVYYQEDDVRQAFVRWFMTMLRDSPDPELILHDEPLYMTARFLGIDPLSKDFPTYQQRYEALARKLQWVPNP